MTSRRHVDDGRCSPPRIDTRSDAKSQPTAASQWHVGNAVRDGGGRRGWFIGPFLDQTAGVRATSEVEIKWAEPHAHDRRPQVVVNERRTTVVILINGRCRIELSTGSLVLSTPGDYAMRGPGIDHSWEALKDSTLITMRWWPTAPAPDPTPNRTESS
jgi:hypothetical protein